MAACSWEQAGRHIATLLWKGVAWAVDLGYCPTPVAGRPPFSVICGHLFDPCCRLLLGGGSAQTSYVPCRSSALCPDPGYRERYFLKLALWWVYHDIAVSTSFVCDRFCVPSCCQERAVTYRASSRTSGLPT